MITHILDDNNGINQIRLRYLLISGRTISDIVTPKVRLHIFISFHISLILSLFLETIFLLKHIFLLFLEIVEIMRFSVEVMAILVAAATSHFVAIQGKLIFVISMKLNIVIVNQTVLTSNIP